MPARPMELMEGFRAFVRHARAGRILFARAVGLAQKTRSISADRFSSWIGILLLQSKHAADYTSFQAVST
jgi:hypothetical protein